MNRLQKKCFIASAGFHLLLALILLIGPAFLSSNNKPENLPDLNFMPSKFIDELASNPGSSSGAAPPSATPQIQQPQPQAAPAATPEKPQVIEKVKAQESKPEKPVKPEPKEKETKPESESLEPAKNQKHKIEVSTTPVVRKSDAQAAAEARAAAAAKETAERNRRLAQLLGRAASNIAENVSGGTDIKAGSGAGGSGASYGNWYSAVKKVYTDAWIVPDGVKDDSATVIASVTIARNGEVVSTSVLRFSGDPVVDQSVKATLDRVRYAPPLPEGAKEEQRPVTINFNVKAKQGLG